MPTATNDTQTLVEYNGKQITYARYRYEVARQNQANLDHVNQLLLQDSRNVLSVGENFGQQEFGGLLRQSVPALITKYGGVNATLAMQYYQQTREMWLNTYGKDLAGVSSNARRTRETRYATARTRGLLQFEARMPKYDVQAKAEPVIGYAMQAFMGQGFPAAQTAAQNAMTRAVASFHRDAILYNAGLDEAVISVQRVAQPDACAFCAMMAFSSERSVSGKPLDVRTGQYAVDFHDHCNCTIETLYEGDTAIRPSYYDKFEQEYTDATAQGWTKAKNILAQIRQDTGRR